MTQNKNLFQKCLHLLATKAFFGCSNLLLFFALKSPFLKKSTLFFWQSMEAQNGNVTHVYLILL
jgi:hypothetical protein